MLKLLYLMDEKKDYKMVKGVKVINNIIKTFIELIN